jgi:hypothetical protein
MMRCRCDSGAGYDTADTSLTLTGRYDAKRRETPDQTIRRIYTKFATHGNVMKPLGIDS